MSSFIKNPFESSNTCPGIQESSIIPILLSSLSSTELCLMFLIERDKSDQNIFYRSRNCDKVVQNGNFCTSCQDLWDNLNHFHHLHLKKSCKQFQQENNTSELEQDLEIRNLEENVGFTVEFSDEINNEENNSLDYKFIQSDIKIEGSQGEIFKVEDFVTEKTDGKKKENLEDIKEKKYTCKYCEHIFSSSRQRSKHVQTLHPDILKEKEQKRKVKSEDSQKKKKNRKCPFCPHELQLAYMSMYKHLLEMHYDEKDNPLYQEIMKKRSENNMICSECGRGFGVRQAYFHHLYKEHRDVLAKDYLCNTCGEGFITNSSLNNHIEKVHENKPKLCVECNKTFATKMSFSHHIKMVHTTELIECKECGKKLHPKTISRHIKMVHIKDKTNVCSECPKAFVLKEQLKKHVEQVHQESRPYGCENCTYRASSITNLNLHRRKMHLITEKLTKMKLTEMINNGDHPFCDSSFLTLIKESVL